LTSVLDGYEWSASRLGRFAPRERAPGTLIYMKPILNLIEFLKRGSS